LTGCQSRINNTIPNIDLPELPLISTEANKELKIAFNPVCSYTRNFISNKDLLLKLDDFDVNSLIKELNIVCSPKSYNTKIWLDELYKFKIRYYIYKEGLK